jgi:hypothetical protein
VQAKEPRLEFLLENHDRARYSATTWGDRPLVLFLADRKGSEYDKRYVWSSGIAGDLRARAATANVAFVSIADLRGTPRLARGFVRGMFEPTAGDPVGLTLLDWQGVLFTEYRLAPGAFHVLAFDPGGRLAYQATLRDFDPAQLAQVQNALAALWTEDGR